jgi:hypothetical protein
MKNNFGAGKVGKETTAAPDVYVFDLKQRLVYPAYLRRPAKVLTLGNQEASATA